MKLLTLAALGMFVGVSSAHANLIQNGSFEQGTDPGSYTTVSSGQSNITDWTVGKNSVDYIGTYWQSEDGSRSIDLSGNASGSISQAFNEVKGQQYLLTFYLAGNPDGAPATKMAKLSVDVGGATYAYQTQNVTTRTNMGWTEYSFSFTGSQTGSTLLTFTDLNASSFGMAIDNISLSAVPLPASLQLFGLGLLGLAGITIVRKRRAGQMDGVAGSFA